MNRENFLNNFNKIFGESEKTTYIYKSAHPLIFLGAETGCINRRVISAGINPDTGIGIRLSDSDGFYVRFSDSDISYECKSEDLAEYSEKTPARDIFSLLGRLAKYININGSEILFYSEGMKDSFDNCKTAAVFAFSSLFLRNASAGDMTDLLLSDSADFLEKAEKLTSLSAHTNTFSYIENRSEAAFPISLDGYKTVIAITGEKPFKSPDFSGILKRLREILNTDNRAFSKISDGDLNLISESSEHDAAAFAKNEDIRINRGAALLKSRDLSGFGQLVKESAEEFFTLTKKDSEDVKILFELSSPMSIICGIYKKIGIFSVVENDKVDDFVKKTGDAYEKKAGSKPTFYICASSETGIL